MAAEEVQQKEEGEEEEPHRGQGQEQEVFLILHRGVSRGTPLSSASNPARWNCYAGRKSSNRVSRNRTSDPAMQIQRNPNHQPPAGKRDGYVRGPARWRAAAKMFLIESEVRKGETRDGLRTSQNKDSEKPALSQI